MYFVFMNRGGPDKAASICKMLILKMLFP